MQSLKIFEPSESNIVVRPTAGDGDRDLIFLVAVERPLVMRGQPLYEVNRMLRAKSFELAKATSQGPSDNANSKRFHFKTRDSVTRRCVFQTSIDSRRASGADSKCRSISESEGITTWHSYATGCS